MKIFEIIKAKKENLKNILPSTELLHGEIIFNNGQCQILTQSPNIFEIVVTKTALDGEETFVEYMLKQEDNNIFPYKSNKQSEWERYAYACLLQVELELQFFEEYHAQEHKKYSKEGMKKRVLEERRIKSENAKYKIIWGTNIYGDHTVINESGVKYKVFLRDFKKEIGYSDSADAKINKLATTKHIMYAFNLLKKDKTLYNSLDKMFPFVEVFCDPLNDYRISWYYPYKLPAKIANLIALYFNKKQYVDNNKIKNFLSFIEEAKQYEVIKIRPEVIDKIENSFEEDLLKRLSKDAKLNYNLIKTSLYPFQKEGIEFALFRKSAIIADEMGLGKTIQAITTAVLKKDIMGIKKTLIVCPASLKEQWQKEIEKFTNEKALIIQGSQAQRYSQYNSKDYFFFIANYESIRSDFKTINETGIDFVILDEAQKVKNYETKTALAVKKIQFKHILVTTGTPIENRLIDVFSIISIIDPHFLGPLWEFSAQYCLFDPILKNKINGYYNLQKLKEKLNNIIIRREKRMVIEQLPNIQQTNIWVALSPLQTEYHEQYLKGVSRIIRKKHITPFDLKILQKLLLLMRMVSDSTYLIDKETNDSPKLDMLKEILLEKMDIQNFNKKIIIFSEWVAVHKLIGRMLREINVGFVELNGKIPVKMRGELIRKFEKNDQYKVFLSTEAGGTGLNLQVADIIINFELPWNPAKKNQRIGRIDRIGQKSQKLNIYNILAKKSIEERIASGLMLKQNLFDGVLNDANNTDFVDFSSKGRAQFIKDIQDFILEMEQKSLELEPEIIEEKQNEITQKFIVNTEEENEDIYSEDSILTENSEVIKEVVTEKQTTDLEIINAVDSENQENDKTQPEHTSPENIEQVMNNGLQFLTGLFKMATGVDIGMQNQKIEINKETGEVTMKFKLPSNMIKRE